MSHLRRRNAGVRGMTSRPVLGLAALVLMIACDRSEANAPDEQTQDNGQLSGLVLSAPMPGGPVLRTGSSEIVYVAAVSGTRKPAVRASISNVRTGAAAETVVIDGGFDPLAIPATEGDRIVVNLQDVDGQRTELFANARRPALPRVVRTSPRAGRSDVPLNSIVQLVFSAPMDAGSVTSGFRLEQAGRKVEGEVRLRPDGLFAEFASAQPLFETDYDVRVDPTVRDVLGQEVGSEFHMSFRTGTARDEAFDIDHVGVHPLGWSDHPGYVPRAIHPGDTVFFAGGAYGYRAMEGYATPQLTQVPLTLQWQVSNASVVRVEQGTTASTIQAVALGAGALAGSRECRWPNGRLACRSVRAHAGRDAGGATTVRGSRLGRRGSS